MKTMTKYYSVEDLKMMGKVGETLGETSIAMAMEGQLTLFTPASFLPQPMERQISLFDLKPLKKTKKAKNGKRSR